MLMPFYSQPGGKQGSPNRDGTPWPMRVILKRSAPNPGEVKPMMPRRLTTGLKQQAVTLTLAVLFFASPAAMALANPAAPATLYPPVELGAASQQIPAGMNLPIAFLTPLDSKTSNVGDIFIAVAAQDLWAGEQLVLPKGSTIRGRVQGVERPGFFSKGGLLRLTFDHVQMPSGELKPLALDIDAASAKLDREKNALYTDPGIGAKLNDSVDKGISQFKSFYDRGIKAGHDRGVASICCLPFPPIPSPELPPARR